MVVHNRGGALPATDTLRRGGVGGSCSVSGGDTASGALVASMSVSVAILWAFLRRVPVKRLVHHPGTFVFQFTTFSASCHGRTHAMVVSGVGDWTRALEVSLPWTQ